MIGKNKKNRNFAAENLYDTRNNILKSLIMKKYLIAGALAFICNAFLSSCSEDMGGDFTSIEEAKKVQFAQNFEKFYGKIAPTQDWGFDDAQAAMARSRAQTRGIGDNSSGTCIKPDMPNYPSATAPAAITTAERDYVRNWFETHPGFTSGLDISNFYVQHVWGLASKSYKVWYNHYDQNYMTNHLGAASNYYRDDYFDNGTIDYLSVGDGTNYTHLNDFNSNSAGTKWGTIYMENSSALSFKYHCSWSNQEFTYFKCAEIDVPGVGKGYYVGMCMYGEKSDNGDRKINKDQKDLQYADDWIIKVIPANGSTIVNKKTTKVYKKKRVLVHKWVFCEDLGSAATKRDYDYNDLVFDAKIIEEYKVLRDANGNETAYTNDASHSYYAEVTPLAAGGELTIKFDKIGSTIHGMFASGVADNILINTCHENLPIATPHRERLIGKTEKYTFSSEASARINNIEILVRTQTVAYALVAYRGEAPHKICVPVGTRWAYERTDIKDAYTGFDTYVAGGAQPWATTGVDENLYPLAGTAYDMRTDKTGTTSYEEISSSSTTEYSYTLVDAAHEKTVWTGNRDFIGWDGQYALLIDASKFTASNNAIGNGTIIRFYVVANGNYALKAAYGNTWDAANYSDNRWSDGVYYGSSRVQCVELKLNTTNAANFRTNGMRLWGTNMKLLAVTYDNSQKVADATPSQSVTIWSGQQALGWNLDVTIGKDNFSQASSTSKIKFTGYATDGWTQIHIHKKLNQWQTEELASVWASNSNDWPGTCEFTIGNYLNIIKSNDICIIGGNLTLTKVELIP